MHWNAGERTVALAGNVRISIDFEAGTLNDGALGMDPSNDWQADNSGSLRGNADQIDHQGQPVGNFTGTPIQALTAKFVDLNWVTSNAEPHHVKLDIVVQFSTG